MAEVFESEYQMHRGIVVMLDVAGAGRLKRLEVYIEDERALESM